MSSPPNDSPLLKRRAATCLRRSSSSCSMADWPAATAPWAAACAWRRAASKTPLTSACVALRLLLSVMRRCDASRPACVAAAFSKAESTRLRHCSASACQASIFDAWPRRAWTSLANASTVASRDRRAVAAAVSEARNVATSSSSRCSALSPPCTFPTFHRANALATDRSMASSSTKLVSTDSLGAGLRSLSSKASQDWRSADRRTDSAGRAGL
mmetsp:Transcript_19655/g.51156  ORF Transcript_19655/g.51156 Transcript_19655/m.51156 type:complete len:214 (+) Transcript_19655:229-870(+)